MYDLHDLEINLSEIDFISFLYSPDCTIQTHDYWFETVSLYLLVSLTYFFGTDS